MKTLAVPFFSVVLLLSTVATAEIRFELPEVFLPVSGVAPSNGMLDVLVRADASDLPADVSGYNVDFSVASTDVTFGTPVLTSNALFSRGMPQRFPTDPDLVRVAQDVIEFSPPNDPLADGLTLFRLPFTVAAGVTGEFDLEFGDINVLGDQFGTPLPLNLSDTGKISAFLSGDYNRNGTVDAADYTVWRDSLGQNVSQFEGADGDGDQTIDADDYLIWKNAFGDSVNFGSASIHVPEPVSVTLAAIAGLSLLATGGRQRQHAPQT